jgi:hypothetical protein
MRETKEWTLMFYFASDNPLAISIVSQLKAIKAAGFHHDANVVAQFDPFTEGTPTHIFDVNLVNKLKFTENNIGFTSNDPFVRNMIEDKLWRDEKTRPLEGLNGEPKGAEFVRKALQRVLKERHHIDYNPPIAPNGRNGSNGEALAVGQEPDPETSLRTFLNFCAEKYPARHYMLFILGHGIVVGNDIFMLDEHATKQAMTLSELGQILGNFKDDIELEGSTFELVSFHSCSVSSLEVAYELQGTANYMLASQGPTFVGSWPYRQILIRIFNDLDEFHGKIDVKQLLMKIFHYCLFNATDFLLAGYSFQLTLIDLTKMSRIKEPVERLSAALIKALQDKVHGELIENFVLLSHWKSQSFFNEMFTDLYDFCFCLSNKIAGFIEHPGLTLRPDVTDMLEDMKQACWDVMKCLVKEYPVKAGEAYTEQIIVAADSLGPAFQYSRGLSVYFPWSRPSEDSQIMAEYAKYKIHADFPEDRSWLAFLGTYFKETQRPVSQDEDPKRISRSPKGVPLTPDDTLDEDMASLVYVNEGTINQANALGGGPIILKGDPLDKAGLESDIVSIKNFPHDTRSSNKRRKSAERQFPLSETFGVFG